MPNNLLSWELGVNYAFSIFFLTETTLNIVIRIQSFRERYRYQNSIFDKNV